VIWGFVVGESAIWGLDTECEAFSAIAIEELGKFEKAFVQFAH